jgi:hypothetical protein
VSKTGGGPGTNQYKIRGVGKRNPAAAYGYPPDQLNWAACSPDWEERRMAAERMPEDRLQWALQDDDYRVIQAAADRIPRRRWWARRRAQRRAERRRHQQVGRAWAQMMLDEFGRVPPELQWAAKGLRRRPSQARY